MTIRLSIDIGGTFTDLVAMDEATGQLTNVKVPSTPENASRGAMNGLQRFLVASTDREASLLVHATTLPANAVLGQQGLELPKTALITTKGFMDVVEIGRQRRPDLYNLFVRRPRPLVPRNLRFEVDERIRADGVLEKAVNESEVVNISAQLRAQGVKAVAVCLINSYANPENELGIKEILRKASPEIHVSVSADVAREYREFERTSTTVLNASLSPLVRSYLDDMGRELREIGLMAPFCIMQSNGGIASKELAAQMPIGLIESGPAAGVIGAEYYGRLLGIRNMITFDMGGTTAKAGIIAGGKVESVAEYEVGGRVHAGRIVKGSGYPVRFPFIDIAECSAGGGTIAWVDDGGALRVGPISAGADPGPACYARGGESPTVTDANLILGRLNPQHLLGGQMPIRYELSTKAVEQRICNPAGLRLVEAAAGIIRIVNSTMAKILRIVSVERGHDPRNYSLIAFGGAGPMHACAVCEELNISRIIVPPNPGLFSAYGLLTADFAHSFVRGFLQPLTSDSVEAIKKIFSGMEEQAISLLASEGISSDGVLLLREVDMRYVGQGYELTVPTTSTLSKLSESYLADRLHKKHEAVYGYASRGEPIELVNLRLTAVGRMRKPRLRRLASSRGGMRKPLSHRRVYFEDSESFAKCPVYDRALLPSNSRIRGPAIVEQFDSTTTVYPGWRATIQPLQGMILERG